MMKIKTKTFAMLSYNDKKMILQEIMFKKKRQYMMQIDAYNKNFQKEKDPKLKAIARVYKYFAD